MRRITVILATIGVALIAVGCSSASADAVSDARAACVYGIPEPVAGGHDNIDWGQVLVVYKQAQTDSAKAAATDPRWDQLSSAYGILVSAWGTLVVAAGPDGADNSAGSQLHGAQINRVRTAWDGRASQAEATVRSQCAIAKAS